MIRSRHRTENGGRRHARRRLPQLWESLEQRRLLSTFFVDNTSDGGSGSLRAAIIAANADASPGTDNIYFDIPASTAPGLDVPVAGFDTVTQDWTITLTTALPTITRAVAIDGYTQGHAGDPIPYQYPAASTPALINSVPNSTAALDGNNAEVRVIVEGSSIPAGPTDIGFDLAASHSSLRGLAIDGFSVGVSIPSPTDVGDLIQGNFIGQYDTFLVDSQTGSPLQTDPVGIAGIGNTDEGVLLGSANATLGGADPQDDNVIVGNGAQGVWINSVSSGNQVLGDQIGVLGPVEGFYFQIGNGAEGVLIQSTSNIIGAGAGNVISANVSDGVHIEGVAATRNVVESNYIGAAPGGGYVFGSGDPGNGADGVFIDGAPDNQIGGGSAGLGNVISANAANGLNISGVDSAGNSVLNNIIGLIAGGSAVLGNGLSGVLDNSAPGTTIGPGNVISANATGVSISGSSATGVTVIGNLIGTDSTGEIDLGNSQAGVEINGTTGVIVEGDGAGSQVISGNLVGVLLNGSGSTGNLVAGNFIGVDKSGTAGIGNSNQGVLIEGASNNTIGGTSSTTSNVISANEWGIQIDQSAASDNLVEGNFIGTDLTETLDLGNELNGVIFTNNASNNTIGGATADHGNTIAFNVEAGVYVELGTGDSILSNSIYSNGQGGVLLSATGNNAQIAPQLLGAVGGGTGSNIYGSLTSVVPTPTTYLIQFFSSPTADPSGFGQGETFLGSTTVVTNGPGTYAISFNLPTGLVVGTSVTAMATNQTTGDTSQFSNAIPAAPVNVSFSMPGYTVASTATSAPIEVMLSQSFDVIVSVNYATSNGSAIAGQDYTSTAGTITFQPGVTVETFLIPILPNPNRSTSFSTVNLTLSQPVGGVTLGSISSSTLTITNNNLSVSTFVVNNTGDSGPGTLRQAIIDANSDTSSGVDNIVFEMPASTAPNLNVPVAGFDPNTQDWTISLKSVLPTITHSVAIDGYTEANFPVGYRYPSGLSSQVDNVAVDLTVSGGTYVLSIAPYVDNSGAIRGGFTDSIPYDATAAFIQNQLDRLVGGVGNVTVTLLSQAGIPDDYVVTFAGESAGLAIDMQIKSQSLTPANVPITIAIDTQGGNPLGAPTLISSIPNTVQALDGNNAHVRVIIDGSGVPSGPTDPSDIGFVINASDSILRGLAIEGFKIGVQVPHPTNVGDLIQGNFIGEYVQYPVDPNTGIPLPSPDTYELVGQGNTQQAAWLGSANTTLGGVNPQDDNVIAGNGAQGVEIVPGASGNQVLGNQIGVVGPTTGNIYFQAGNGAEGVLILSSGTMPSNTVYASSNIIGGSGAGNLISANLSFGVHIVGVGATRNLVESNYIGVAPGGGFIFGQSAPGNLGDGVRIDNAPDNQIGGPSAADGNVISANQGFGVNINGTSALDNTLANNIIGLTAAGSAALGNNQGGVVDYSPLTVIGPGNVISANLLGVLISGGAASDVTVIGNLIGTDITGEDDLGNAEAGVDIEGAAGATISGNASGSQVISGNQVGVKISGASATGNLVEGNFIGIDKVGNADRGNSNEGVLIEGGANNTIGGTTASTRNVISANLSGVKVDGPTAVGNSIEGNFIGSDVSGTLPLGNEVYGVVFSTSASNNTVGGTATGQGNLIANNSTYGVYVESGNADSILSNSIFNHGHGGIILNTSPNPGELLANDLIPPPTLTTAIPSATTQITTVQGMLNATANATYLIQFFSNLAADPAGLYEGQTFLGSTIVTTNASGSVTFSQTLTSVVASSSYITATATSFSTVAPVLTAGDTSQFSSPGILAKAVSVQFSTSAYTVSSSASTATINVLRTGNTTATVTVNFATSNGTALAGRDYVPASGTLTFGPGVTLQTFTVTILPNTAQASGTRTLNLTLSQPGGGAALGTITMATLAIELVPGPPTPPVNATYPKITSDQLITNGKSITGLSITFSKAMNLAQAQNLGNYGYYVFTAGYHTSYTPIATYTALTSAVYNSSTNTVLLTPASPLPFNKLFQITVDGQASPLLHNGLVDLSNNQLLGSNGNPGTPFIITFEAGSKFSYIDSASNAVSLQLAGGGLMELFIDPTGSVQELELAGAVAGKTSLSGSVKRSHGSSGRTALPPITGSTGVRIKLNPSQFAYTTDAANEEQSPVAPTKVVHKSSRAIARATPARRVRHKL